MFGLQVSFHKKDIPTNKSRLGAMGSLFVRGFRSENYNSWSYVIELLLKEQFWALLHNLDNPQCLNLI